MRNEILMEAESILKERHEKLNENVRIARQKLMDNATFSSISSALQKEIIENAKKEAYGEKVDRKKENKLNDELNAFLREKNIDLTEKFSCHLCDDSGYKDGKMCACLKKEISALLFKESNFGNLVSFDDAKKSAPKEYQKLYDKMKEWCHSDFKKNLIFIAGKTGVGKTYLASAIAKELMDLGRIVKLVTAFQMSRDFKEYRFSYNEEILNKYLSAEFLFIDDLGTETLYKNITVDLLFHVINERKNRKLCTILTSNLTLDEIYDRYDERIFSRIVDRATSITLNLAGLDLRTKKK